MPTFTYQARDAKGERVSGAHEAADQRAALEALRATGLFVTKLEVLKNGASPSAATPSTPVATDNASTPDVAALPSKKWQMAASEVPVETPAPKPSTPVRREATSELSPLAPTPAVENGVRVPALNNATSELPLRYWLRANNKELSLFFRQMHAMLHAGVSLGHALNTMATSAPSHGLREACGEMSTRVSSGKQFSELMKSYPGIFTPLMSGMIRAGELGGFLDRMCQRLSEYAERDYEIEQTIKRETWYPKLLVFMAFFIPSLVPAVVAMFTPGGGNPMAIWFRTFVGPASVMLIVFLLFKFKNYLAPLFKHFAPLVYLFDQLKLYVPVAGKTSRALATAKFCRALGALQSAGMGIQQTINLAADACGNAVIAETSRKTIRQIEAGSGLTDALASTGQFPGVAIQMMRTGEDTGNFDEQLSKVADFLEGDAETTIKQSVALLGVLIFLVVAGYIGLQVVKQYSGYNTQVDQLINEAN